MFLWKFNNINIFCERKVVCSCSQWLCFDSSYVICVLLGCQRGSGAGHQWTGGDWDQSTRGGKFTSEVISYQPSLYLFRFCASTFMWIQISWFSAHHWYGVLVWTPLSYFLQLESEATHRAITIANRVNRWNKYVLVCVYVSVCLW